MTLPHTYRTVALTLRKTPMGEADLVATIYSGERGKLPALARSARRLTSKLMGHFEPLTLLELALTRGRDLDIVAEAQVINAFPRLKAGYDRAARGLYVAELLDAFCPVAAANRELFNLAVQTLHTLNDRSSDRSSDRGNGNNDNDAQDDTMPNRNCPCVTLTCNCSTFPAFCPNSTSAQPVGKPCCRKATATLPAPAARSAPIAPRPMSLSALCR